MNYWGLKLLSLGIAIVMALLVNYVFVYNESGSSVRQVIVPIEVSNVPADKIVIWPPTRQAEVTIQGPTLLVSRIASAPPVFSVVIPPEAKQHYVAPLTREGLSVSRLVEVLSIKPPEIEFTLDSRISRSLPVVVPRVGGLPEDLRLEELLVDPVRVEVRGPETELKPMASIETYPLDLSQVTENIQRELDIRLPGNLSEVTPTRVTVKVRVTHQKSEERISGVPVEVRSVGAEGFVVDPSMVDIRLIGIRDALKALERAQVIPYVRVGQIGEQRQKLRVEVEVPKGITVLAVEPAEVDVVRSAKVGTRLPLPKTSGRSGK